jgi:cytoskeletal protein CcmA (bactofilin family)
VTTDQDLTQSEAFDRPASSERYDEITAFLGKGTSFEGRLLFEGVVRIDGHFCGDIFTRDTLVIGPEAVVTAQVDAEIVIIAGRFEGRIRAGTKVEILETGSLRGVVQSPALKIQEGGIFDGTTQMEEAP